MDAELMKAYQGWCFGTKFPDDEPSILVFEAGWNAAKESMMTKEDYEQRRHTAVGVACNHSGACHSPCRNCNQVR